MSYWCYEHNCPEIACSHKHEPERTSPAENAQPSEPAGLVERMQKEAQIVADSLGIGHLHFDKTEWGKRIMTAALAVARAEFEKETQALKDNADFLRKSVGVCHLMISRDDLSVLDADKWGPTSLPPRLKKYIETKIVQQLQQKLSERDKEWEQAIKDSWDYWGKQFWGLEHLLSAVRARLGRKRRVTIRNDEEGWFAIYKDGAIHAQFAYAQDAERYAAGLRAEIESEGSTA